MKDSLFKIKQIAGLVIFIIVLSFMGMITGRPVMMIAYAGFFLLVSFVIYMMLRKKQRHFETTQGSSRLFKLVLSAVLMVLALIIPTLTALRSNVINLPVDLALGAAIGWMAGVTIVFTALVLAAVYMINYAGNSMVNRIVGFALFVLAAIIPGALMVNVDSTTMGIGSVYYVAMAVLILAYNAMGLFLHKD
jgi:uncharacterized membrane protein (DUF485 family)